GDRGHTLRWPNGLATFTDLTEAGLPRAIILSEESRSHLGPRPARERELFALLYEYDDEDRVASVTDTDGVKRQYAHDAGGRLLAARAEGGGPAERFEYDGVGNRTRCGDDAATFNPLNQLLTQGGTRAAYDDRGNLTSLSGPGGNWQFAYKSPNLLVEASKDGGAPVTFRYAGLGPRVCTRSAAAAEREGTP